MKIDNLNMIRILKGYTGKELAERINYSQRHVEIALKNKKYIKPRKKIIKYLKIPKYILNLSQREFIKWVELNYPNLDINIIKYINKDNQEYILREIRKNKKPKKINNKYYIL